MNKNVPLTNEQQAYYLKLLEPHITNPKIKRMIRDRFPIEEIIDCAAQVGDPYVLKYYAGYQSVIKALTK